MNRFVKDRSTLSIIIPVWGDEEIVVNLLQDVGSCAERVEWIVAAVDPGPTLHRLAQRTTIRLVTCPQPSRGGQMNAGAALARGRLLCFHHADTALTPAHIESLLEVAEKKDSVGGAFHRKFDNRHPIMKQWEKCVQFLDHHWGPFFGDQSIFIHSETFRNLGGFADMPLMEDLDFTRRMKAMGTVILLNPPIWSSSRRFHRMGNWRTTFVNAAMILLYSVGVPPQRLHRWYYAHKPRSDSGETNGDGRLIRSEMLKNRRE